MSVGIQPNNSQLNGNITQIANSLRKLMSQIQDLNTQVNGTGQGTVNLEGYGYDAADAVTFLQLLSYLNNIAGCYYGTVQQGGSGGSGAILFDFDNALSLLWAGALQ